MKLRSTYLYQEDVAQIIDCELPICMFNNRLILISGSATDLLGSYLISNLVALKKFYDLNFKIIVIPSTKEYFGCSCIKGVDHISDINESVDFIFDLDHLHTEELTQRFSDMVINYVYVTSEQTVPVFNGNHTIIKYEGLFGLLHTDSNAQTLLENAVKNNMFDTDKKSYFAMSAEYLIKEILLYGINPLQSCKLISFEGEIIVEHLNNKTDLTELEQKYLSCKDLMQRDIDESDIWE